MSASPNTDTSCSITVNGDERTVPPEYPLVALLTDLEIDPDATSGVAVAINASVIRRQDWDDVRLSSGDTVEVIQAQQGG